MAITPLPTPPSRAQSPANFSSTADTFVAALPTFVTESNALAVEVDGIRDATAVIKTETQVIKDDAVSETAAIKTATEGIRDAAGVYASSAESSAVLATTRAAEAASSANFRGAWSSLSGALNVPASVLHNGQTWRLMGNLANVAASEPGVTADWTKVVVFETFAYDDRGDLRSTSEVPGAMAMVEGLGLFVWYSGSTEPDDDESCFATANGRWLLEAVHWDVVDAWQSPDWEYHAGRILTATFENTIETVNTGTFQTITVSVPGASTGDSVVITQSWKHINYTAGVVEAMVLSDGTVTVYLFGGPPNSYPSYFHTGTWRVTVIKP